MVNKVNKIQKSVVILQIINDIAATWLIVSESKLSSLGIVLFGQQSRCVFISNRSCYKHLMKKEG